MMCDHPVMADFKNPGDPREWVCSGCGKTGLWTATWSYFGSVGCRHCHLEPVIEFVACSEACRETRSNAKRIDVRSRLQEDVQKIDATIADLQARRKGIDTRLARLESRRKAALVVSHD